METRFADRVEPLVKYHPSSVVGLTTFRDPEVRPCLVGSLTVAVAS